MMGDLSGRQRIVAGIVLAQVAVLLAIAFMHGARIADGTTVRVAVQPVDPLDLARGAYVELRYDFEDLALPSGAGAGDEVYVLLSEPRAGDVSDGTRILRRAGQLQDGDLWITLPIGDDGALDTSNIDTQYLSGADAAAMERDLADGAVVELSLDEDGTPMLLSPHR